MAPLGRLDLVAVGVAVSMTLSGCGDSGSLLGSVSTMIGSVCKTTIEGYLVKAEEKYDNVVIDRCNELRDVYHQKLVGKTEADEFYNKCINTAGASVDENKDKQLDNYTSLCSDSLKDSSVSSWSEITAKVKEFFSSNDLEAGFDGTVGSEVNSTLDDFVDNYDFAKPQRLYDSGIRSVASVGINSVALACVIGGMLAGAAGLVAVFRRSSHQLVDNLIEGEESDLGKA